MKKGFSLIELSITILIIGVLVGAIYSGSQILDKIRLVSARSVTQSSPISSMTNLIAWWETTSSNSFLSENPNNDDSIIQWNDISPNKIDKISLTQSNSSYQPKYIKKSVSGLPALKFDGNDRFITDNIFNKDFSLFVVMKTTSNDRGGQTSQAYQGYAIIGADISGRALDIIPLAIGGGYPKIFTGSSETTLSSPIYVADDRPYILFSSRDSSNGKRYLMVNNNKVSDDKGGTQSLGANSKVAIGADSNSVIAPFKGHISEIIIFDEVLEEDEITKVQNYLAKKYSIKL